MNEKSIIPHCLRHSDQFQLLGESERVAFTQRLLGIVDIANELVSKETWEGPLDLPGILEDIELELSARSELSSATGGLSLWGVHRLWTSQTSPLEMNRALPKFALESLDIPELPLASSMDSARAWFEQYGHLTLRLVRCFSEAKDCTQALSTHIAIDATLVRMLLCVYKMRLNAAISR